MVNVRYQHRRQHQQLVHITDGNPNIEGMQQTRCGEYYNFTQGRGPTSLQAVMVTAAPTCLFCLVGMSS